jgi:hypothetical protein
MRGAHVWRVAMRWDSSKDKKDLVKRQGPQYVQRWANVAAMYRVEGAA